MSQSPKLLLGPLIGGLSDTAANLWARADGPGRLRAWLGRRADFSDAAEAGKSRPLRAEDGFAGVAPVGGLRRETTYYYAVTLTGRPPAKPDGQFTTFPRPGRPRPFSFAFGSCFCPGKIANGEIFASLESHRRAVETDAARKLRFTLLIGDQVYADDWKFNGLKEQYGEKGRVAVSLEDYRNVYAHVWGNEHFRAALTNLPAFMTLDDHEVDDDWRWTSSFRRAGSIPWWDKIGRFFKGRKAEEWRLPRRRILAALQAYWEHQGMHAPPMTLPPEVDEDGQYVLERYAPGSLAYSFTYGCAAFFVLDTRSMRVKKGNDRRMLGDDQWRILKAWLLDAKDRYPVKFIVTSCSILFPMWIDIPGDRWSGFREERDKLLRFIGENDIRGVYFLAGDLHSGHAVSAEIGPKGCRVPVWEFCSTPFEQETNRWARCMYLPILSGLAGNQKPVFTTHEPHFGVVEVTYPRGKPSVKFCLYNRAGDPLHPPVGD
ncbi:MAG: Biopolymer transporter ExbB [Anaerolineaceae bacterium]|nr:MAG: Biopolymer transporter ExbB [Anaerolineaceae bacterium]